LKKPPRFEGKLNPVWIEVGRGGGFRDQSADRVVDDQVGPDLLVDQVRQPRAKHPPGPTQMRFELVVGSFFLPPLVISGSQLVGAGVSSMPGKLRLTKSRKKRPISAIWRR